jgi:GMP synthase (glutamine-hydrolysing)
VNVLAVIHGDEVRSGVFGPVIEGRGHVLEEWSLAWGKPPPRPIDDYGAVLVFGGAMHADQDDHHPWLREENLFLQRLLHLHVPVLGVCLGAQLLAKAAHSTVGPAVTPEIGWYTVELTDEAADDPLFSRLPRSFEAFQWHYYTYGVPAGADELATSESCTQAFRLGDAVWGIQFHAEVTLEQVQRWLREEEPADVAISVDEVETRTKALISDWNDLGRTLCDAFVEVAERVAESAPAATG